MKKIVTFSFLLAAPFALKAQFKLPAASPAQTITQDFGPSSIVLTYARPGLKDRKMFGAQVPWDVVWRTGANNATLITFNSPVEVAGHHMEKGTYALYTIPRKKGDWTLVFNTGTDNWGVNQYKEEEDIFRTDIKAIKNKNSTETLAIQFTDVEPESCTIEIKWENYTLQIPVVVHFKDQLRKELEAALQSENKPYFQAAQFYKEYDNNLPKALEMIDAAISSTNDPAFYVVYYKAKIQQAMGDKEGAIKTSEYSLDLSKKTGAMNYIILNEYLLEQLKK